MSQSQFKYSSGVIAYPLLLVLLVWFGFWYQIRVNSGFKSLGIRPLELDGLIGIVMSPFIHGSFEHLYHNSIPLLILTTALFYFYRPIRWKVLVYGILLSGFITWLIGRPANHIGASGLVYVLVSFIFFKGVFAKHYRLIALSLIVVFLYGSMVWYVFPIKDGMSWEGHLAGLITGLFFAVIFKSQIAKPERYEWQKHDYNEEEDEFMKHFDKDGNFIESVSQDEGEQPEEPVKEKRLIIRYIYKKKKED